MLYIAERWRTWVRCRCVSTVCVCLNTAFSEMHMRLWKTITTCQMMCMYMHSEYRYIIGLRLICTDGLCDGGLYAGLFLEWAQWLPGCYACTYAVLLETMSMLNQHHWDHFTLKEFSWMLPCRGVVYVFTGSLEGSDSCLNHWDTASGHHMLSSKVPQCNFHPPVSVCACICVYS